MDDDLFEPLMDFIPINVSDSFHYTREMCKTKEHRKIWDTAVKECIKSVVLETKGFSLSQIEDFKWLLFEEWEWEQDVEFIKEAESKGKYHTAKKPEVASVRLVKDGSNVVDKTRVSMWQKIKGKIL